MTVYDALYLELALRHGTTLASLDAALTRLGDAQLRGRIRKAARAEAKRTGSLTPPAHILNAPTKLMKDQGYGAGYAYDHDAEDGFSGQNYFPEGMKRTVLYVPVERGFERELKKRLDWFVGQRAKRGG